MADATAPRPLLRRMLSFREPLLLIPHLVFFLGTVASAFFHSYASFLQSFARSVVVPSPAACAKCAYAASSSAVCCDDAAVAEERGEGEELRKEEVEAIMARIGLGVAGAGEGLRASMGRNEVSRLFDAEEPSFAEVRRAFAVFDGDADGFIGAADLQGALARLGFPEVDAAACRAMISSSCGSTDGRMNLFQFVRFLEDGLC
ncbi:putative calcium-binding protein CML45 [Hordeum vulgare]|uniref:EF-hand domain-containing protein n=2 Tax=Hordeum vulgare subsp. vulgare TaxID=112509 RepID=A0A8I6XDQ2_HORVV|nr:probable calcium-binding protein CML46 [Hordeum vulgare subsp. vulgare]KAE8812348.1 putative calcium-binding protein CML45 [Hordeum vulgare]